MSGLQERRHFASKEKTARRFSEPLNAHSVVHAEAPSPSSSNLQKNSNIDQADQHIRPLATGAGVCEEELPWVAPPVRKKIGQLKKAHQAADKLFRDGCQDAYEKEAKHLYGLLREASERGLEEVLLGGVVERFRPSVQTQRLSVVADITHEDCQALDAAMTKCSRWLTGLDQAAAARAPVPDPTELKDDIEALESWRAGSQRSTSGGGDIN